MPAATLGGAPATPTLQIERPSMSMGCILRTEGSDADFNFNRVGFTVAPVVAHPSRTLRRRHEQFTPLGFFAAHRSNLDSVAKSRKIVKIGSQEIEIIERPFGKGAFYGSINLGRVRGALTRSIRLER